MEFNNKNILIISPKPWGVNNPARQSYARELARQGNFVYFLNPPSKLDSVTERTECENLFVVDYKPRKPLFGLGGNAENYQIRRILKLIGKPLDIAWSFDASRFRTMDRFAAKLKLFSLEEWNADLTEQENAIAHNVDVVLGLSQPLLDKIGEVPSQKVLFQHGVNDVYLDALKRVKRIRENTKFTTGRLRCGYIGNFQNKYIETELFQEIIRQNPIVEFHMIGPFVKESNLANSGNKTWEDPFVENLMNAANVRMYGSLMTRRSAELLQTMDMFLVCYDADQYSDQVANPLKILEYLSAGRVIVGNYTDRYKGDEQLMVMARYNKELPNLFKQIVDSIEDFNAPEKCEERVNFAKAHSFPSQLKKIEDILSKLA